MFLEIYTDGACSGNPGPGGYGAILKWGDKIKEISGFRNPTTNNQMELLAVIEALKAVRNKSVDIKLYSDSKYVGDGIQKWIHAWRAKGWKTADNKPVKNQELWQELDQLQGQFQIEWHWIKGHAGHEFNERADALARAAIKAQGIAANP